MRIVCQVGELVKRFSRSAAAYRSAQYNEAQARIEFINPFFEALGFTSMATNSGKGAFYGPSHAHVATHFGTLEQCLEAAVRGEWQ